MNVIVLAASAIPAGTASSLGDTCALALFGAAGVSFAFAAFLLRKAPRYQPRRYRRRR